MLTRWVRSVAGGLVDRIDRSLRSATRPVSLVGGLLRDVTRSRGELLAENMALRQQLIVVRAPRMNANCERFLGSARRECVDHVFVLGERHLDRVLQEYCFRYFNPARPHQGMGQLVPFGSANSAAGRRGVVAVSVHSGLHHDYQRAA